MTKLTSYSDGQPREFELGGGPASPPSGCAAPWSAGEDGTTPGAPSVEVERDAVLEGKTTALACDGAAPVLDTCEQADKEATSATTIENDLAADLLGSEETMAAG